MALESQELGGEEKTPGSAPCHLEHPCAHWLEHPSSLSPGASSSPIRQALSPGLCVLGDKQRPCQVLPGSRRTRSHAGGTIGVTLQRGSITPFPLSSHPRRGDAARQAATSGTGATATRQAGCEAARGWLSAPIPHPQAEEHPHHLPNPSCSPKPPPKSPEAAWSWAARCQLSALPSPPCTSPAAAASS